MSDVVRLCGVHAGKGTVLITIRFAIIVGLLVLLVTYIPIVINLPVQVRIKTEEKPFGACNVTRFIKTNI